SRRRHTRWPRDWSSDVCSSDLSKPGNAVSGVGFQGTLNGVTGFDWSQQTDFALRLASDLTVKSPATLTLSAGTIVKAGVSGNQRSEERRVGKEGRGGVWREREK